MFSKCYLEITNACNLHCSFCPGTRRQTRFLTEAEFRLLASRLRPHCRFLYFHVMGEPLLHPGLSRFLEIAGELGFRVVLTTNGTLLSKRRKELLAAPSLHKVNVSLHAPEANGSTVELDAYLKGCADFVRSASRQGTVCCLRLWNLDGEGIVGENAKNGVILDTLHAFFPSPWTPNSRGMQLGEKLFLEWDKKFQWPDAAMQKTRKTGFCRGLRDQVAVLCDGTVVPCCLDHEGEIALGNLFTSELSEILESPRARALYQGFSNRIIVEPLCRTCGYAMRFDGKKG